MVGLILAVLYVGWKVMMNNGMTPEAAFLGASTFLYYWYWTWSIICAGVIGFLCLVITLGAGAKATEIGDSGLGKTVGFFGGVVVGGGVSLLLLATLVVRCALYIVGAYLLMTSGTPDIPFAEFNHTKLIVGGILLLIALLIRSKSSSSSKSDRR